MLDRKDLAIATHQVAGHGQGNVNMGLLQVEGNNSTVLKLIHLGKKAGRCEYEFYERTVHEMTPKIRPFIPRYHGKQQVMDSETKSVKDYLQLENVLRKFKKPCLIDIKLGYRTYDEDASTLKISQEIAKYFYQKSIGFRLSGMKIYNHQTEKYEVYSRDWGRSISPSRMHMELCKFFLPSSHMTHSGNSDGRGCCGQCCSDRNNARNGSSDTGSVSPSSCQMMDEVARCRLDTFIDKIGQLLDIFQNDQDKFRFYACSILCVYEGDWTSVDTLHECEVKLIDFAHVFRIPTTGNGNGNGNGGGGVGAAAATATDLTALLGTDDRRDQNTLFGLRSVLGYLLEIRTGMTTPRSPVDALVMESATNGNGGGGGPFASVVVKEREEELNETAAAAADCKSSRCA